MNLSIEARPLYRDKSTNPPPWRELRGIRVQAQGTELWVFAKRMTWQHAPWGVVIGVEFALNRVRWMPLLMDERDWQACDEDNPHVTMSWDWSVPALRLVRPERPL